jgi:hypothetical protein
VTNDQMKPGRLVRCHHAHRTATKIAAHLTSGGNVLVGTYKRTTLYSRKHADMFRATSSVLFARNGNRWDCIDHCAIRFL